MLRNIRTSAGMILIIAAGVILNLMLQVALSSCHFCNVQLTQLADPLFHSPSIVRVVCCKTQLNSPQENHVDEQQRWMHNYCSGCHSSPLSASFPLFSYVRVGWGLNFCRLEQKINEFFGHGLICSMWDGWD